METTERVSRLRAELARQGLTGFLVPRADEHQGEYVPPRAEPEPIATIHHDTVARGEQGS